MTQSEARGLRLQVFLARAGRGSRRTMEQAIRDGRVAVDGQVVTMLGVRVDPEVQEVRLDGQRVRPAERPSTVIVIHKPPRVLTTTHDPHGRPTVLRLLPASLRRERLFPVGRLDFASEGLVLLTNDGELAFRLMHPRFGHEREYVVTVRGPEPADLARRLTEGIDIGDRRPARAVRARRVNNDWQVVLTEGRKRQVRRMFEAVGMRVTRLRRVRLGPVTLGDLASGAGAGTGGRRGGDAAAGCGASFGQPQLTRPRLGRLGALRQAHVGTVALNEGRDAQSDPGREREDERVEHDAHRPEQPANHCAVDRQRHQHGAAHVGHHADAPMQKGHRQGQRDRGDPGKEDHKRNHHGRVRHATRSVNRRQGGEADSCDHQNRQGEPERKNQQSSDASNR